MKKIPHIRQCRKTIWRITKLDNYQGFMFNKAYQRKSSLTKTIQIQRNGESNVKKRNPIE